MVKSKEKSKYYLAPEDSVGYLVRSLHRSFNRLLAQKLAPVNLTTAQWFFLRALWENDGISQRELSNIIGLKEPTTVSALKILEKNGIVKRKRDTKDVRRVIVRLTRKGRRLEDQLVHIAREINVVALKQTKAQDVKKLKELLKIFRQRLDAEVERNS